MVLLASARLLNIKKYFLSDLPIISSNLGDNYIARQLTTTSIHLGNSFHFIIRRKILIFFENITHEVIKCIFIRA